MALTSTQKSVLIKPAYTGNISDSRPNWIPVINIMQSDKQYEAFGEDGNQITKAMYGKLFIRKDSRSGEFNTLSDLVDEIGGTVMKIQYGHEIYEKDLGGQKGKMLESNTGMIPANQRETWIQQNPDKIYKNMVKVVLATKTVDETKSLIASGVNPFCVLVIKGNGWGNWFDTVKEMDAQAMASALYEHQKASDLAATVFKFTVKSSKDTSEDGFVSYSPIVEVSLNSPDMATAYYELAKDMENVELFSKRIVEKVSGDTVMKVAEAMTNTATKVGEAEIVDAEEYLNSLK